MDLHHLIYQVITRQRIRTILLKSLQVQMVKVLLKVMVILVLQVNILLRVLLVLQPLETLKVKQRNKGWA